MKVEERTHVIEGNMSGEKIAMGIAVEDMAHIMGVMTDLYKDRLKAVIREYSTNAWDAHVEAGVERPIEIKLPSHMSPTLEIQDYGVGLSAEDIRVVYSQYGRSTKRNTNDQVGMLGLGCKSALTYASQFTVTSVKDGVEVAVMVSRDEDGGGSMQILHEVSVEASSGTRVSVAIDYNDIYTCADYVEDFFGLWPKDAVRVNGQPPIDRLAKCRKLTDTLYIQNALFGYDMIVMGNVAYPYPLGHGGNYSLIAFVDIGDVKPTPSRESLMDTKVTRETAERIMKEFKRELPLAAEKEIDAAETPGEAIKLLKDWQDIYQLKNFSCKYKGKEIPTWIGYYTQDELRDFHGKLGSYYYGSTFAVQSAPVENTFWHVNSSEIRSTVKIRPAGGFKAEKLVGTVWITGFDERDEGPTPAMRKKAEQLATADGFYPTDYIFVRQDEVPYPEWIREDRIFAWSDVKKQVLPAAIRSPWAAPLKKIPGSYPIITEEGAKDEVPGSDLRTDVPMFTTSFKHSYEHGYVDLLGLDEFTVVKLAANRVAKFMRTAPDGTEDLEEAILKAVQKRIKGLTKAQFFKVEDYLGARNLNPKLDPARLKDPKLKLLAEAGRVDVPMFALLISYLKAFKTHYAIKYKDFKFEVRPGNPFEDYPLINMYQSPFTANPDHAYLYVNTAYKELIKK